MKPKLYLETSIISYLTARLSSDYLVSTRQRENAVGHAPALRERDAGASRRHSHAGAWKREKKLRHWSPKLQLWQRRLTLTNLVQI